MKYLWFIFIPVLLFAEPVSSGGNEFPPPLVIDHNLDYSSLSPHLSYYVDETGSATIDDIKSLRDKFIPMNEVKGAPSFGYSKSAYWFKLRVLNSESVPLEWILEFEYPLIDYLDLFVPENETYHIIKTGDYRSFNKRPFYHRTFVFPLEEQPGERLLFLRVESAGSLTIPLSAWSPEGFQRRANYETVLLGFMYGILFIMAVYYLFLYFPIRERSYLFLSAVIASVAFFFMVHNGTAFQYLWPENPDWGNKVYPASLALANLAVMQFGRVFLNTSLRFPYGDKAALAGMGVCAIIIPSSFLMEYYYTVQAATIMIGFTGITLISTGVISLLRGYREARYYLIACLIFLFGAFLSFLRAFGIIPENMITAWSSQIGMVGTALLFSFAIAEKIYTMQQKQDEAEDTIEKQYEEIQSQNVELEELNQELTQARDVQVELNEKIAREKEQLTAVLKSIKDAVIAVDSKGCIILMNSAGEELTKTKQDDALGCKVTDVLKLPSGILPDWDENSFEKFDDYKNSPPVTDLPVMLEREDELECYVEIAGAMLHYPGEKNQGMVLAIRDITEKMKLEKEILKVSKIESLSMLAGGIAHDFNNLLTSISGNLSLALTMIDENNRECIDVLERIEQASGRAATLTRQLLTFSKGGAPVKAVASVSDLVQENIDFLLSGSSVNPVVYIQEELNPVEVDSGQISQVIQNLIINALEAMPEGGTLDVDAVNIESDSISGLPLSEGSYVRISFKDSGPGISRKNQRRIFDPYFTTKSGGTGLGLSICYSIVMKHGGYIDVDSSEGEGTAFHVYLPSAEGKVPVALKKKPQSAEGGGRILVMDDDEEIRKVAAGMLKYIGYEVESAADGEAAIELYRRGKKEGNPFSAVIMDLTVPGGTGGREAVRQFLKYDPSAVILVSSGYSEDPVMADYRKYGFKGAVPKPYTLEELARILDEVLN